MADAVAIATDASATNFVAAVDALPNAHAHTRNALLSHSTYQPSENHPSQVW